MKNKDNQGLQAEIRSSLKKTNYYQILQLKDRPTDTEIRKSYKKLALKYHPDKNSAEGSKQLFSKIVQAYDTLSNQEKRYTYDESKKLDNQANQKQKKFNQQFKKAQQNFQRQRYYYSQFQKKYEQFAQKQRQQEKKNKKPNQQNKKSKETFESSKENSNFKQKTSNRPSFYKYKSNIEEEIKFQKQISKINARMYKVQVALFILAFWIFIYIIGPYMKGTPYYSMDQTPQHQIQVQTQLLKIPFFVKQQYFQQAQDQKFKQNLQKKVDQIYIKGLSKICNNILKKQQVTLEKLRKIKSKQLKKTLKIQLQSIDKTSCDILHQLRQINPSYFISLFKSKDNL